MSSKFYGPILTGFFLVVSIGVAMKLIAPNPKHDYRVQEQIRNLEMDKIELKRRHLQRDADLVFYGCIGALTCVGLAILIVSTGLHRAHVKRAQVHTYKIGESEVVIHERDLSLAAPVALGLMNAEQLKQMNGGMEKAFELACTMADIQSRQIRALVGKHPLQMALPAVSEHHPDDAPAHIPTFADLLRSGQIGAQQPLLFGFHNGQPRSGTWQEIFSNATGGQSGSGKTNTLLSLIGQSVLHGIGFWVIDYHWPHDESLLAKLGSIRDSAQVMYAEKPIDVRLVLDNVNECIDRRLRKQEPSTPIRVLCIDEVLRIVKNCAYTEEIIERIGTEGRKVNIFGLFAAQSWKADKVDTTARDNLTSIFAHYMKPNQAKPLLQDSDKEKLLKHLHKGQMVFCPVMGEPEILDVPYVSPGDMEQVNTLVNSQPVDQGADQASQHTGLVKAGSVDLVDRVRESLKNAGDFSALVQSTGLDKAYVSRILNRKQNLSRNAEDRFHIWLKNH
jgi:hypothetical protein